MQVQFHPSAPGSWQARSAERWSIDLFGQSSEPSDEQNWLRRIPGRETFLWSEPSGAATYVVKRFRGDQPREIWFELLRARAPVTPAAREFGNLKLLGDLGLPVPKPVLLLEGEGRSALMMEALGHAESLKLRLARCPGDAGRWVEPLARTVCALHNRGWYHRDLYLNHILVAHESREATEHFLVDLGRARHQRRPRERWFVKDLAALAHSCPPGVSRADRLSFLRRYLEVRGSNTSAENLERWVRRIVSKQARLAAHAPRHVDPASDEPLEAVKS